MGQDTRQNRSFSVPLLHRLLDRCLMNAKESQVYDESHNWLSVAVTTLRVMLHRSGDLKDVSWTFVV
jgi:hypothetical protein